MWPAAPGPIRGRFGTLGRNTYRGPGVPQLRFLADQEHADRTEGNPERIALQFRFEVFNAFNIVNFSLPSNIVLGPGFGVISRTAGPSRQIQLSLKILY